MTAPKTCDVLICGGAVIGSSVAWFLSRDPSFDGSIVVVERDPTYRFAATALAASGIRQQFSSPLNVRISQFGVEFIRRTSEHFGAPLTFHENGYLYLAGNDEQERRLRRNHQIQTELGATTILLSPDQLAERFPHLNISDIPLGSLGQSAEGWFDNMGLLNGFRTGSRSSGVTYLNDEVSALAVARNRVTIAKLASGATISCGQFVNASGTRAATVAAMAGLSLPVEPRKRTNFLFASARPIAANLPLMIDPTGVWCRPEGERFLCGCNPVDDPTVDPDDFEPRFQEFDDIIWPVLANRSPAFEAIKLQRYWAGHYDMNIFDHNVIVGPHPDMANFYFANGFSGHGLQQSPAIGRGLSELLAYGEYRALDLSSLGYGRILSGSPNPEDNVI